MIGIFSTNSGGGGSFTSESRFAQSTIVAGVGDDRADRSGERYDEDQQQRHRHDGGGEPALAPGATWRARRSGHVDPRAVIVRRPDDRGEERPLRVQIEATMRPPMMRITAEDGAREVAPRSCSMVALRAPFGSAASTFQPGPVEDVVIIAPDRRGVAAQIYPVDRARCCSQ